MTREEAIKGLKSLLEVRRKYGYMQTMSNQIEALDMAIKSLEQETVSKESYDHEYFLRKEFELKIDKLQRQLEGQTVKTESILDKIRAEIEFKSRIVLKDTPNDDWTVKWNECIKEVLEIIDKYKSESEDKE